MDAGLLGGLMEDWEKIRQLFNFGNAVKDFSFIWAIVVFFFAVILDILWAFYQIRTTQLKSKSASGFSSVLYLVGGMVVISYAHNILYIVVASLGAGVGTYIAIEFEKRKRKFTDKIEVK